MGPQAPKAPPQQKSAFPAKAPGFLDRLLALFASDDPERQKQRQLRDIAAELQEKQGSLLQSRESDGGAGPRALLLGDLQGRRRRAGAR